jgi:hypothetical protein
MIRMTRLVITAAALAMLAAATPAAEGLHIGPGAGTLQPTLIRVTGFVKDAPNGVATLGSLTLGVGHKVETMALTEVQILNGPLTEGPAALRQYWLYNPNLLLIGNSRLLEEISSAPTQTKLTLFAYLECSNRMLVVKVDRS